MKHYLSCLIILLLFINQCEAQKYKNGTRLLKGAEVLSNTPLQLDYVLENLSDTANVTSLHEGKTHLILNDGSGEWREWWFIKGHWQLKALSSTDTLIIDNSTKDTLLILTKDSLIINHFTKDTLVISKKDTLVFNHFSKDTVVVEEKWDHSFDIAGEDGALLYLQKAQPAALPYLKTEEVFPNSSLAEDPKKGLRFNFSSAKGTNMYLDLNKSGYRFSTSGYSPACEHYWKNGQLSFQVYQGGFYSNLSMDFAGMILSSINIQSSSRRLYHVVSEPNDYTKNTLAHLPDKSYFRLETETNKESHPYTELYLDREKLEFRTGTMHKSNGVDTPTPTPPFFTAGTNFNYLDNLKYDTSSKTFFVKNKLVFTDTENNTVASIFVNATKNDIEFTSNALNGEIISLLEISKMMSKPNSEEFIPKDDGEVNMEVKPHTTDIEATESTSSLMCTIVTTLFIYGDIMPDLQENTLYLQLNSTKELWLHLQMNGITKRIKLE